MAERLLLIRYEPGRSLRAVPAGGDPYTEGTNLTDHGDGFYSAMLPTGVYDIYYKNEPDDSTWLPLEHYQGRFHPTDDITDELFSLSSSVTTLEDRVSALEGSVPGTPQNVKVVRTAGGVHISWDPQNGGTIYIVRGVYHHSGEQVNVDETSRVLYAGYTSECLLSNELRFADLESRPYGDVELSFRIWACSAAGTSEPSDVYNIKLDLAAERAEFCRSAVCDCGSCSARCEVSFVTTSFPGAFPKTTVDEQGRPAGAPARTLSFSRDVRILRVEAESLKEAQQDCCIYFCDAFSGQVYKLAFGAGERFARSEETAAGNPSIFVMRYPDSKLLIYSDDAESLTDVEIRLELAVV